MGKKDIVEHQFKPGQSGNLSGRPVGLKNGSTIAKKVLAMISLYPDIIFEDLRKQYPELEKQTTVEEMIMIIQADKAIRRKDTVAASFLMDRAHGKPKGDEDANLKLPVGANINIVLTDKDDESDPM